MGRMYGDQWILLQRAEAGLSTTDEPGQTSAGSAEELDIPKLLASGWLQPSDEFLQVARPHDPATGSPDATTRCVNGQEGTAPPPRGSAHHPQQGPFRSQGRD